MQQQQRLLHVRVPSTTTIVTQNPASRPTTVILAHPDGGILNTFTRPFTQLTQTRPDNPTPRSIAPHEPLIHSMYEKRTGTWQYVVADPSTKRAIIIDPVLDYDAATHTISTSTADAILALITENEYHVDKMLETHAHADHLTAASYLQHRLSQQQQGCKPGIGIGRRIKQVQEAFARKYGIAADEYEGVFDHLFQDDETFDIGELTVKVIHLPGHTPDHVGYQVAGTSLLRLMLSYMPARRSSLAGNVFCGDSILHADIGSARCDFPGGSAKSLYASTRKLLDLPDNVKIWTGHDYPACPGRCEAVPWMTVRDHKKKNKHLSQDVEEEDFLRLRQERDAGLAAPKLLDASLQINIRAGRLPRPTPGGKRLIHLPMQIEGEGW